MDTLSQSGRNPTHSRVTTVNNNSAQCTSDGYKSRLNVLAVKKC
jgi:hypothetical protein